MSHTGACSQARLRVCTSVEQMDAVASDIDSACAIAFDWRRSEARVIARAEHYGLIIIGRSKSESFMRANLLYPKGSRLARAVAADQGRELTLDLNQRLGAIGRYRFLASPLPCDTGDALAASSPVLSGLTPTRLVHLHLSRDGGAGGLEVLLARALNRLDRPEVAGPVAFLAPARSGRRSDLRRALSRRC